MPGGHDQDEAEYCQNVCYNNQDLAAAGIAVINSIGNLAGFAGPYAMGWIKDTTGSFTGGLLLVAALAVVAMVIVLLLGHDHALEKAPGAAPALKEG